jgi:hypothetical protein
MKKKHLILLLTLVICIFIAWFIYNSFREWECCDYTKKFKKANEIIQKIENYRKCHGRLPESLKDVGYEQEEKVFGGPIFYDKTDSDKYIIWFGAGSLGSSCIYHSETGKWTPTPVG